MLKVTGLSLLLGSVALVVVLTQFFAPPATDGAHPLPVLLNPTNARIQQSEGKFVDGELQLKLNSLGLGVVTLATEDIAARDYPFLHLALEDPPHNMGIGISLKTSAKKKMGRLQSLEKRSPGSVWLAMNELEGWTGTVDSVQLTIVGQSGETVRIKDLSLYPVSLSRQLRAIYSDFTGYAPWRRADMNSHTGVAKVSSFYPVPLVVTLLLLSTLGYGLLLILFRAWLKFNWTVVALIFLACWIGLDLVWQNRLLQQVAHTYRTFSGKDTQEKLAVGPDSKLFNFISEAKQHIEPADARVFVSSTDIYKGMRGAYYLYPFNVYWSLELPEIPTDTYFRKGDYVVLIRPTTTRFYRSNDKLRTPYNRPLAAELIFSSHLGTLVRLK
jgi:hypothetical protein